MRPPLVLNRLQPFLGSRVTQMKKILLVNLVVLAETKEDVRICPGKGLVALPIHTRYQRSSTTVGQGSSSAYDPQVCSGFPTPSTWLAVALVQAPATKKLWGGRFRGDIDPIMDQFNSSLQFDKRMWAEDLQGSKAYAKALAKAGERLQLDLRLLVCEWSQMV